MAHKKFKFNPETLNYDKKSKSKSRKILEIITTQIVAAVLIAVVIFVAFSYVLETPKQRKLKNEISVFEKQYDELISRRAQQEKYMNELKQKDKTIYREIFQSDIETDSTKINNKYIDFQNVNIENIISTNKDMLTSLNNETLMLGEDYSRILKLAKTKQDILKQIPAIQPIFNKDLKYPLSGFGKRIDQLYKSPVFHDGIDYAAPEGTKVFATADGVVIKASTARKNGLEIVINHGHSYKTRYAHLSKLNVKNGQHIKRGDIIAYVGNTGKSLTPHLHYEIIYNNKPVNPVNYFFLDLSPEEYFKIKNLANKTGMSLD